MTSLLDPIQFRRGPKIKNRFFLAPLTNQQSNTDGTLGEDEFNWLIMRAKGGFGMTMTCASHVQEVGKMFPGQLGIWSDHHLPGLKRVADAIKAENSLAIVQLHHGGLRTSKEIIGCAPVSPSGDEKSGARALSTQEVKELIEDFISAAVRAEQAGFHGVELHGAHGYLLCAFLAVGTNQRQDQFGGSVENRARVVFEIIDGIRKRCGENFIVGVRLSAERYGLETQHMIETADKLLQDSRVDFLDMSLWDIFKEPEEEALKGKKLMSYFTDLERGQTKVGVAGKIRTPNDAEAALKLGADWVMLGRAAMLEHDFPNKYSNNPKFEPVKMPVTREYLLEQGLTDRFQDYVKTLWPEFFPE